MRNFEASELVFEIEILDGLLRRHVRCKLLLVNKSFLLLVHGGEGLLLKSVSRLKLPLQNMFDHLHEMKLAERKGSLREALVGTQVQVAAQVSVFALHLRWGHYPFS